MAKYPTKTKNHTIYLTSTGKQVVGASTIAKMRAEDEKISMLMNWASKLSSLGIDHKKYTAYTGELGTLAHYLIQCHLEKKEPDTKNYSIDLLNDAMIPFNAFLAWVKDKDIEPILMEKSFTSDNYFFGGTIDCYCKLGGKLTLLDFKTGSGIREEYWRQLAGYNLLLRENGYKVDQLTILRLDREGNTEEKSVSFSTINKYETIFIKLCEIYQIENGLEFDKYKTRGDK